MAAPLLIDFSAVPAAECNDCIEGLFKALAERPAATDPDAIWRPVENPWLTFHTEDVTARLLSLTARMMEALEAFLSGRGVHAMRKALASPWLRWDPEEFARVRAMLEAVPPGEWTLTDYELLVDYIVQRYLPDDVIRYEAEYLAVRAGLLGKMQAAAASRDLAPSWPDLLPPLVPTSFRAVPPKILSPIERAMIEVAHARAANAISDVTDAARSRMKRLVVEHVQGRVLGQPEATDKALQTALFDEFSILNRDFRRIAVTEVADAAGNGFVGGHKPGTRLQRLEAYKGACDWCKSINGMVLTVTDPSRPDKDGDTEVWVGKTNARRSASPRKRAGGALVDREAHERWWVAAGAQHPHCRGSWTVAKDSPPPAGMDPAFVAWLRGAIKAAQV